jgi:hypothetical protein
MGKGQRAKSKGRRAKSEEQKAKRRLSNVRHHFGGLGNVEREEIN